MILALLAMIPSLVDSVDEGEKIDYQAIADRLWVLWDMTPHLHFDDVAPHGRSESIGPRLPTLPPGWVWHGGRPQRSLGYTDPSGNTRYARGVRTLLVQIEKTHNRQHAFWGPSYTTEEDLQRHPLYIVMRAPKASPTGSRLVPHPGFSHHLVRLWLSDLMERRLNLLEQADFHRVRDLHDNSGNQSGKGFSRERLASFIEHGRAYLKAIRAGDEQRAMQIQQSLIEIGILWGGTILRLMSKISPPPSQDLPKEDSGWYFMTARNTAIGNARDFFEERPGFRSEQSNALFSREVDFNARSLENYLIRAELGLPLR